MSSQLIGSQWVWLLMFPYVTSILVLQHGLGSNSVKVLSLHVPLGTSVSATPPTSLSLMIILQVSIFVLQGKFLYEQFSDKVQYVDVIAKLWPPGVLSDPVLYREPSYSHLSITRYIRS